MSLHILKVLALFILFAAFAGTDEKIKPAAYPDSAGPFTGDWQGRWQSGEDKHPDIAAQVIPLGNDAYQVVLVPKLYVRVPPFATIHATASQHTLHFDDGVYYGEISGDEFTGGRKGDDAGAFTMERFVFTSPTLGAAPPEKAIVLFNGSNLEEWVQNRRNRSWEILEGGILQANPNILYLETKRKFKDCRLHLEFRTPFLPEERGQDRANSGVFLQRYYEVQILDSYGLPGYWNECAALYRISAPYVNMCLPPLQWQTFDIEFRAARFDEQGNLLENARMTVLHNGVAVQKDQELPHGTSGDAKKPPVGPVKEPENIRLQAHKNHVQFRNIWMVDLEAE